MFARAAVQRGLAGARQLAVSADAIAAIAIAIVIAIAILLETYLRIYLKFGFTVAIAGSEEPWIIPNSVPPCCIQRWRCCCSEYYMSVCQYLFPFHCCCVFRHRWSTYRCLSHVESDGYRHSCICTFICSSSIGPLEPCFVHLSICAV